MQTLDSNKIYRNNILIIRKIITGGQTGIDQWALDFAMDNHIQTGGYCPKGRRCEAGRIPDRYPLTETDSPVYQKRTQLNVKHSDGTLIMYEGRMAGGTLYTFNYCKKIDKPLFVINLSNPLGNVLSLFLSWFTGNAINTLNIAGPRASENISKKKVLTCLHHLFIRNV